MNLTPVNCRAPSARSRRSAPRSAGRSSAAWSSGCSARRRRRPRNSSGRSAGRGAGAVGDEVQRHVVGHRAPGRFQAVAQVCGDVAGRGAEVVDAVDAPAVDEFSQGRFGMLIVGCRAGRDDQVVAHVGEQVAGERRGARGSWRYAGQRPPHVGARGNRSSSTTSPVPRSPGSSTSTSGRCCPALPRRASTHSIWTRSASPTSCSGRSWTARPWQARGMGFTRLSLETGAAEFYLPARKLYEKFGFNHCPAVRELPARPERRVHDESSLNRSDHNGRPAHRVGGEWRPT